MRLNKYLAHATGMSRRDADMAISAGRVFVNGFAAVLGAQVDNNAIVTFDRRVITSVTAHTYLMFNKPVGYLCSRRSQGGTPTIYEILPEQYRPLKPVGRLDKDSSGLLLLTDDGDFAHSMTHPSFHKMKSYEVELDKPLQPLHQQMISDYGITLEDGVSKFIVERIDRDAPTSFSDDSAFPAERGDTKSQLEPSKSEEKDGRRGAASETYRITMHEGRNRQIRRTFAALCYTVTALHRTTFGNYSLGDIKTGEHVLVDIR